MFEKSIFGPHSSGVGNQKRVAGVYGFADRKQAKRYSESSIRSGCRSAEIDPSQAFRTVEGSRMRKIAVLFLLASALLSLPAFAQDCTTYVLVAAYDKRSGDTVENLKGDDFEARVNGKEIPVLNATQDYSNRL